MIAHRIIASVTLEATSPARVGSSINRPLENAQSSEPGEAIPVARSHLGDPILPGTSAAGVLRHQLERQFGRRLPELFGDVTKNNDGSTEAIVSSLIIDDAPAVVATNADVTLTESATATARWRTAHDRERDAAATHLLFGAEELPQGTVFTMRLQLDDPSEVAIALFAALLQHIDSSRFRIGAATRTGFGEVKCTDIEIRELRIDGVESLKIWLLADDRDAIAREVVNVSKWIETKLKTIPPATDKPDRTVVGRPNPGVRFRLSLIPVDPLHSKGEEVEEVDRKVSKMSRLGNDLVLTGPTLRGAIRSRAERIVRTVNGSNSVWNPNVAHRSGTPEPEEIDAATDLFGSTVAAGWAEFSFTKIEDPLQKTVDHVAIDRFTGGAAPQALFREEVVTDGDIEFVITLAGNRPTHVGLLTLALLDLATGDLPLGSGRYRGQGTVRATRFTVEFANGSDDGPESWDIFEADLTRLKDWRSRDALVAALDDDVRRRLSDSVEALWSKGLAE